MAAKSSFRKIIIKIYIYISEISTKRADITCHKETIENLKNRGNFPESYPLIIGRSNFVCMRRPSLTDSKYKDRAGF